MKKFIATAIFIIGFGSYALYAHSATQTTGSVSDASLSVTDTSSNATAPNIGGTGVSTHVVTTPVTTKNPNPTPAPVTAPVTKLKGQYTDGSYTGVVADAYYGNVQVRATVSGGKLTNVAFLQYPNDRQTSREINQQAMPYLKAEAIQAQSANVNGVSGASDTSAAFVLSLGAALAHAKA
jgi:uncharacterized protein with FMN-binding domain